MDDELGKKGDQKLPELGRQCWAFTMQERKRNEGHRGTERWKQNENRQLEMGERTKLEHSRGGRFDRKRGTGLSVEGSPPIQNRVKGTEEFKILLGRLGDARGVPLGPKPIRLSGRSLKVGESTPRGSSKAPKLSALQRGGVKKKIFDILGCCAVGGNIYSIVSGQNQEGGEKYVAHKKEKN